MAYNEDLASRVLSVIQNTDGFEVRRMFGGVCCLIHGHMVCGVIQDDLIVRVGPDNYQDCLARPHAREFDFTGRPMKGWVMIASDGLVMETELESWIEKGRRFVGTLPAKSGA